MTEETRELLRLTAENGELRGRLSSHSREIQEYEKLRKEFISVSAQLEIARNKAMNLEELYEEISEEKNKMTVEFDDLKKNSEQYETDLPDLQNDNFLLNQEYNDMFLANIILSCKGLANFEGGKIKLNDIKKALPTFEHDETQDFSMEVSDWVLEYKAEDSIMIIKNKKK